MNIYQKLSLIQNEMKVPKNLYNSFGKYSYRNAEAILEEAKPICNKHGATLVVSDEIVNVDGRFYVKAIATLYDWNTEMFVSNTAYAREEENKKGMDGAQVTGSTSSYARKYCLNGLFNLDDTKDADSDEHKVETTNRAKAQEKKVAPKVETVTNEEPKKVVGTQKNATESQLKMVRGLYTEQELSSMLARLGRPLEQLTIEEASKMIKARKVSE